MSVAGLLLLTAWAEYRISAESAPVARGANYAFYRGCIECHGDPDNPLADSNDETCSDSNYLPGHPEYSMSCSDVLAYFESVRLSKTFAARVQNNNQNPLIAGEELARKYHCFNCHGQLGQGGVSNSRSFKGYVPGYFGKDFKILTRNADPDSVRRWIMYGIDTAILQNPVTGRVAQAFFDRQAINMPSFRSLEPAEIETLVKYVIAINQYGPMTAGMVRSYAIESESSSDRGSFIASGAEGSMN